MRRPVERFNCISCNRPIRPTSSHPAPTLPLLPNTRAAPPFVGTPRRASSATTKVEVKDISGTLRSAGGAQSTAKLTRKPSDEVRVRFCEAASAWLTRSCLRAAMVVKRPFFPLYSSLLPAACWAALLLYRRSRCCSAVPLRFFFFCVSQVKSLHKPAPSATASNVPSPRRNIARPAHHTTYHGVESQPRCRCRHTAAGL